MHAGPSSPSWSLTRWARSVVEFCWGFRSWLCHLQAVALCTSGQCSKLGFPPLYGPYLVGDDLRKSMKTPAESLVSTAWSTNGRLLFLVELAQLCPFSRGHRQGYRSQGLQKGVSGPSWSRKGRGTPLHQEAGPQSQREAPALTERMKASPASALQ